MAKAESFDCARSVYTNNKDDQNVASKSKLTHGALTKAYRPAEKSDQKRQLSGTRFAGLELSPVQATKINAFARSDPDKAMSWLSPRQVKALISRTSD